MTERKDNQQDKLDQGICNTKEWNHVPTEEEVQQGSKKHGDKLQHAGESSKDNTR